jgi:hypothetical protein
MDVGTCDARYPELHVRVVSSSRLPLLSPPDAGHPLHSAGGHEAVSRGNRQPSRKASHDGSEPSLEAGNDRSREALDDA